MNSPLAPLRSFVFLALASIAIAADAPAPTPAPAPSLAPDSDRARMIALLGLPTPPRAAPSNTVNEDIAAPNLKLPDPLIFKNGQPVKDAAAWQQRRQEIYEDFQRDVYGRIPAGTPKVTWEVTKTEDNGEVKVKTVIGRIDNSSFPAISPSIEMVVSTPSRAAGPVPLVVYAGPGNLGGRRGGPPPAAGNAAPAANTAPAPAATPPAAAPARGPTGPDLKTLTLARGWGYATFNTSTVQPDNAAGLTQGIIGLMNKGQPRARPDEWGVLLAWSWGLSKAVDYFETDADVDAKQLAVDGFSRWGKTAVLAAVVEPRWALAWAGDAGEGGTKIHRRNFGETVDMVAQNFPWWMAGNFQRFFGKWNDMPVDSHELVALVAPRPVFITTGTTDLHTDPKGTFLAAAAASPVYELLGKKGVGATEMPAADVALISGDIGFRMHTGGHTPAPDYATFLEFAGKYFKTPLVKLKP